MDNYSNRNMDKSLPVVCNLESEEDIVLFKTKPV